MSSVRILSIGDICIKKTRDLSILGDDVYKIWEKHEYITCDFGIPLNKKDTLIHKCIKAGPHEMQDVKSLEVIKKYNIGLARLAGNHIMDFGDIGMADMCRELDRYNIDYCGVSYKKGVFINAYLPVVKSINGKKLAFFSAGECSFGYTDDIKSMGYAWINSPYLLREVKKIRSEVDFCIVYAHAGLECVDTPLKEWRERYKELIDSGVDCVIGTHPHIIQGIEEYNNGLIVYSMGNFYYDNDLPYDADKWFTSLMVSIEVKNRQDFSYQVYVLKHVDGKVVLADKSDECNKRFQRCNAVLKDDVQYKKIMEEECLIMYQKYYEDYIQNGAIRGGLVYDYAFLWHNLCAESLYYAERTAIKILYENGARQERNPYRYHYILWGYGKIGHVIEAFLKKQDITIVAITDVSLTDKVISREKVFEMLENDRTLKVCITTDKYYEEIKNEIFDRVGKRYIFYRNLAEQITSYRLDESIKEYN